jgi:hypothetical protein
MNARIDRIQPWWERHNGLLRNLHCDEQGGLHVDGQRFAPQAGAMSYDAPSVHDDPRVAALQQYLYHHYYTGLTQADEGAAVWRPEAAAPLVSGPWRVLEQLRDGAVIALRGTLVRRLEPGEYLYDGVPARAGRHSLVTRSRPRWSTKLDPAFVYLFGQAEADACTDDAMVRYYFAPYPAQLGQLVQRVCQALDRACVPYSLKYPAHAQALLRNDAVVLYTGARHAHRVHACLAGLAAHIAPALRPATPLWSLPLLPGLGFAQDPAHGLSFGESRCRALALGLFDAARADDGDAMRHVRMAFVANGIDWDAPYLDDDEDDRFGLRQLHFAPRMAQPARTPAGVADEGLWQASLAIGQQLCADALWHGAACTWITDDADDEHGGLAAFARSMNGSLYDGTLGVAAYLTVLAGFSADDSHRETAIGALWHALQQRAAPSISLYEGRLGIVSQGLAWARQLDEPALEDGYLQAAGRLLDALPDDSHDADLMHGLAGAILALLGLARQAPSLTRRCHARARQFGSQLISLARKTPHGWHWPGDHQALGLCGLSHGNAGIALAFAALHGMQADPAWQRAIDGALAYEAFWYLPQQGNWPYLFAEDADSFAARPENCGMAWCHGAPGIAQSRLALWRLTGDAAHRQAALTAFGRVADDLADPDSQAGSSYTLCHGPAGNADMLLDAARYLEQPQWTALARRIARQGVAQQSGQWHSGLGVAEGHATGLMLGLAGTGYFLLRAAAARPVPGLMLPFGLLS